jgi:hypothetical protein
MAADTNLIYIWKKYVKKTTLWSISAHHTRDSNLEEQSLFLETMFASTPVLGISRTIDACAIPGEFAYAQLLAGISADWV